MMALTVSPLDQRPDLTLDLLRLAPMVWPHFVLEDDVSLQHYGTLFEEFSDYQFVIRDEQEQVIAGGSTIPLRWDGTLEGLPNGWDGALKQGVGDRQAGRHPTALSAVSATIHPAYQGLGLGKHIIRTMRRIGATHGLGYLICPVRPSWKSRYPLTAFEAYIGWKRPDGSPFDPWLRTHWREGAQHQKIEPVSMVTTGAVAEWEAWTQMRFPESGAYIVPGALVPITIDHGRDLGRYAEPNVWMTYDLSRQIEEATEGMHLASTQTQQTVTLRLLPTRHQHQLLLDTARLFQRQSAMLALQAQAAQVPSVLALSALSSPSSDPAMSLPGPLALRTALLAEEYYQQASHDGQMPVPADGESMPLDAGVASFEGLTHLRLLTRAGTVVIPFLIEQIEPIGPAGRGSNAQLRLLDRQWYVLMTLGAGEALTFPR